MCLHRTSQLSSVTTRTQFLNHRICSWSHTQGQSWRDGPVDSIPDYLVARAQRRYGLSDPLDPNVVTAWELLSAYSESMCTKTAFY
jgi:hypothetical protein